MSYRSTLIIISFLLILPSQVIAKKLRHSIVAIYSTLKNDSVNKGTGFYINSNGEILTAYHVVKDSKKITIFDHERNRDESVNVLKLYPNIDLAILKTRKLKITNQLRVPEFLPNLFSGQKVSVLGHPHGIPYQKFSGTLTNDGLIMSEKLWHRNRQIFEKNVEIIPLDITSDKGISGAPVVNQQGRIIGIFSGSYGSGRTYAWAIPITALHQSINILKAESKPANIDWPSSQLMRSTWNSLTRSFSFRKNNYHVLSEFDASTQNLSSVYISLTKQSRFSLAFADEIYRVFLDAMHSDEIYNENQLQEYIDVFYELQKVLTPFKRIVSDFQTASTKLENSRRMLQNIVVNQSNNLMEAELIYFIEDILAKVIDTNERADDIFKQIIADISSGLNDGAKAIKHKKHLSMINMESKNRNEKIDKEIRAILLLLQNAVFTIQSALDAATAESFLHDSSSRIKKLSDLSKISEIILFKNN